MSDWKPTEIGSIPGDWNLVPLRELSTQIVDGTHFTPRYLESGVPFIRVTDIQSNEIDLTCVKRISEHEHRLLNLRCNPECGDVLLSKNGTVGIPKVVTWTWPFSIFVSLCLLKLKSGVESRFLSYILESSLITQQIRKRAKQGTVTNLHLEEIRDFLIPCPIRPEQRRITRILMTLDNLIEKTVNLIAKYQAVKQGMMHDLFTRGVDAHGKLRPPQAEAPDVYKQSELGWIPKEWNVRILSDVSEVSGGVTLGRELVGNQVIQLPYLRVANVQDGYLDLSEIKTVPVLRSEVDRFALRVGDVLMTEGGDFDKLGRGTVWRGQIASCLHQNHIFRVRPSTDLILPDFLASITASSIGKRYFLISSKQTTNLASINSTQLKKFPVPVPRLDEQTVTVHTLVRSGVGFFPSRKRATDFVKYSKGFRFC